MFNQLSVKILASLLSVEVLDALHMDTMMSDVESWRRDPESFLKRRGLNPERTALSVDEEVFVLIVEGFLIFNCRYTTEAVVKLLPHNVSM